MDQDYSGQQLADTDHFLGQNCQRDRFCGTDLAGADFTGTDLRAANFRNARLTGAKLSGADLSGASLSVAQLGGAELHAAKLCDANLTAAHLHGADLENADLSRASLFGANLRGANLTNANLLGADLEEADLTGANLRGTLLEGTNLTKAILEQASLVGARVVRADLPGANFRRADLTDAVFEGPIDFTETDFSQANFNSASLERAQLSFALLRGADLSHANLRRAILSGVDLRDADLSSADVTDARLHETDLRNAKLDGTRGLVVDRTRTGQAIFSHPAPDPWSVLRRYYSGHRFSFALMLLILSLVPYVTRALFWSGVSEIEQVADRQYQELAAVFARLETSQDESVRHWASELRVQCQAYPQWKEKHFEHHFIIEVLFGVQRKDWWKNVDGWWHLLVTVALLLFNVGRGVLVWRVGPMKDEEDRTGVSPPRSDYLWMFRLHRVVIKLWWVSIITGVVLAVSWLFWSVLVPRPKERPLSVLALAVAICPCGRKVAADPRC